MTGPTPAAVEGLPDLSRRDVGVVAALLLALVVFGFYPMPLLNVINPYVDTVLTQVGVTDEAPVVPAPDTGAAAEGGQE